jgi:rhodanese-related sulfurtransferase
MSNPTLISVEALAALMRSDAPHAVLDLRERGTYERGHVFCSTSLPRRLLEFRLHDLVTAPATPIVLCDEDGTLSALAIPTLAAMGYRDVRLLAGGLAGWRNAGRPLVQGVNVPSKVFGERTLHERKTPQITAAELDERIRRGDEMVIVDARTVEEYSRGCIPGAVHVPGGELVLRITELLRSPRTPVVVHCGGRTRSYLGVESLRRMELPNPIVALENGTMGWELAGLSLERQARRWMPAASARSRGIAEQVASRVAAEDRIAFLSPAAVRALWARREAENVQILDVRTREEYEAGHLPGAQWVPGGQAVQATDDAVAVRAASLVLVCDGRVRSIMTASWLARMGLPNVFVLEGGVPAWTASGGLLQAGPPASEPFGYEAARQQVQAVPPATLHAVLAGADPPVVLDVGTSDAYVRGHVPGAAWLCRSRLELRVADVAADRARAIVTVCGDGRASTLAAVTLRELHYASTRVLDGGAEAWVRAGLSLEPGTARLVDVPDDVAPKASERGRAAMQAYLRWEECLDPDGRSPYALLPETGS